MQSDDPLADAKKLLSSTEGLAASVRKPAGGKDVELPNPTGEIDPRLIAARSAPKKAPIATPREQPRSIKENVALRRSLTAGGRR